MSVFVRTFGCSANLADSQTLSGCLVAAGFKLAASEQDADLVIYNSCAVKGPTENRIIDALKRIPKNKKIIVAGCLPLVSFERLAKEVKYDAVAGPALGDNIVDVAKRVLKGETLNFLEGALGAMPRLDLPRIKANPIVSIVPVNYGCLGSCAFCCVMHARGRLRSYSVAEIVKRVENDVSTGAKEVWITSQDSGCYGRELGTNLAELLRAVTGVDGDFRIRIGMMTPSVIKPFLDELIRAFESPKIFKFVHLPVQSGDDEVLRRMRRFYTASEFKGTVAAFRNSFSTITVSTDIICGFPGETEEAFQNTLRLIREVAPDVVNVSKFFARPKTAAWKMGDQAIDKLEIRKRSIEASKLVKEISFLQNRRWLGWSGDILIDEKGKATGTWIGRNFAYKPIAIRCSSDDLLGKTECVKIVKAFPTHLFGVFE